ncbi:hypothetical protein ES707_20556 [subsurface metagenome]
MWYGCHVSDAGNVKAGTLKGTNGSLAPTTRPFNIDLYLSKSVLHCFAGSFIACQLSGIGSAFARTLKSSRPRA